MKSQKLHCSTVPVEKPGPQEEFGYYSRKKKKRKHIFQQIKVTAFSIIHFQNDIHINIPARNGFTAQHFIRKSLL